jgi:hypothetical protein
MKLLVGGSSEETADKPVASSVLLSQDASLRTEVEKTERWYYDQSAKVYWVRMSDAEDAEWVSLSEKHFALHIQVHGVQDRVNPLTSMNLIDEEILRTTMQRRVSYAGALAGWKRGVVKFNGTRALITRSPDMIKPVDGDTPILDAVMSTVLCGQEEDGTVIDQRESFFAWWKHALASLYDGRPRNGLAMAIAGEKNCGKTLVKNIVKMSFGGAEALPYRWMIGEDNFNRTLSESPLWTVDDAAASTKGEDRGELGAQIKQIVANSALSFRGMHQEAVTLNPFRRLFFCLNIEPDRLLVLPPMDDDIDDKIMLLKAYKGKLPMPTRTPAEQDAFWGAMMAELPAWIGRLLSASFGEHEEGRFGVRPYHHPHIMQELSNVGAEMSVLDWIDRAAKSKDDFWQPGISDTGMHPFWEGTATDLRIALMDDGSVLKQHERKEVPKGAYLGVRLSKLAKLQPERFLHRRTARKNFWMILRRDPAASDHGGMES